MTLSFRSILFCAFCLASASNAAETIPAEELASGHFIAVAFYLGGDYSKADEDGFQSGKDTTGSTFRNFVIHNGANGLTLLHSCDTNSFEPYHVARQRLGTRLENRGSAMIRVECRNDDGFQLRAQTVGGVTITLNDQSLQFLATTVQLRWLQWPPLDGGVAKTTSQWDQDSETMTFRIEFGEPSKDSGLRPCKVVEAAMLSGSNTSYSSGQGFAYLSQLTLSPRATVDGCTELPPLMSANAAVPKPNMPSSQAETPQGTSPAPAWHKMPSAAGRTQP